MASRGNGDSWFDSTGRACFRQIGVSVIDRERLIDPVYADEVCDALLPVALPRAVADAILTAPTPDEQAEFDRLNEGDRFE